MIRIVCFCIVAAIFTALLCIAGSTHAQFGAIGTGSATPAPTPGVTLNPGQNLTTALSSNPGGTVFSLTCGTYRFATDNSNLNALSPPAGDQLIGCVSPGTCNFNTSSTTIPTTPPCVVLNGSIVIPTNSPDNSWHQSGSLWYNTVGATYAINSVSGGCLTPGGNGASSTGACSWPQDLFYDGVIKPRITDGQNGTTDQWPPAPGFWYFDIKGTHSTAADTVWVADNPSGHTVELSVVQKAFAGGNANVTLQNLTMQEFASPYQDGMVEGGGNNWNILNNWFQHGHGYGVKIRPFGSNNPNATTVKYNEFMENGQAGFGDGTSTNGTYSNNQLDRNGEADYAYAGEGGNKFTGSNDTISFNTVNYENGVGLWTDSGASNETISHNTVTGSIGESIRCEISHGCVITDNTVNSPIAYNNNLCITAHVPTPGGNDTCTGPQTGTMTNGTCTTGSFIATEAMSSACSDHSTIGTSGHGNTINSACGGVVMSGCNRNSVSCTNNLTEYNTFNFTSGSSGLAHAVGGNNNWNCNPGGNTSCGLYDGTSLFDHNTYTFNGTGGTLQNWEWLSGTNANGVYNFSGFKGKGEEPNGSCTANGGSC